MLLLLLLYLLLFLLLMFLLLFLFLHIPLLRPLLLRLLLFPRLACPSSYFRILENPRFQQVQLALGCIRACMHTTRPIWPS